MQNSKKNTEKRRRRNKYDIIAEMLELMKHPIKKSHIVGSTYSNSAMTTRYLSRLEDVGMIERIEGNPSTKYRRTEKGEEYLDLYNRLNGFFE